MVPVCECRIPILISLWKPLISVESPHAPNKKMFRSKPQRANLSGRIELTVFMLLMEGEISPVNQ